MKFRAISLALCLYAATAFSQEFFFIDQDEVEARWSVNINDVRESHNRQLHRLTDVFSADVLKMLLGEKKLLDRRLNIFQLAQVNNGYLRMLRNMVYARYGLIFKADDLNTYFKKIDWYAPKHENVDKFLTDVDKDNVKMIQAFEKRDERRQLIVDWGKDRERIGVWQESPQILSGYPDRFEIYPNNKMKYYPSEIDPLGLNPLHSMAGVYLIKGNVLEFRVNEVKYFMLNTFNVSKSIASEYDWDSAWDSTNVNTVKLGKPMVYKFPISEISTVPSTVVEGRQSIKMTSIGGKYFYMIP